MDILIIPAISIVLVALITAITSYKIALLIRPPQSPVNIDKDRLADLEAKVKTLQIAKGLRSKPK